MSWKGLKKFWLLYYMNTSSEMQLESLFKRHVIASDSLYYHNSWKLIGFRFMEKYANLQRIWHTVLIVGIKVVHTEFIWLSLITERNLIILDTPSDLSRDAYNRKEVVGMRDCQFKYVMLNNGYLRGECPSFLGSTVIRNHAFKVNKMKGLISFLLTQDEHTISLCGVGKGPAISILVFWNYIFYTKSLSNLQECLICMRIWDQTKQGKLDK